jgi:iron complex transport system ATP-binding protein
MISIQNGHIGYNEPILSIELLEIEKGTLTALVGKNGSGKSTLLKTLCGMIPALGGNVLVGGKQISACSEKERSRLVAFVGSSQSVIPYLSVKDFVLLGRSPYTGLLGRYREEDREVVCRMLALFHLEHLKEREFSELSDGERQLAAFARAFTQETPVILMDEPTAFLDYGNKRSLLKILKKVTEDLGKSVILSTHDLDLCLEEHIGIIGINQSKRQVTYHESSHLKDLIKAYFSSDTAHFSP